MIDVDTIEDIRSRVRKGESVASITRDRGLGAYGEEVPRHGGPLARDA
jgi:hypothetical protein